ncbi:MAG: HD domain-containing protein [Patescibacteria group bacterium]|nr:HD domain-containing protein [Patescibacteria group bacterium]
MEKAREIINKIKGLSEEEEKLILTAFDFSKEKHEGQKRLSGEPYFTHLYETAKILAELGMSAKTISAGLLHDILEDSKSTREEVKEIFGKDILFLVEGVTKLKKLKYRGAERHRKSLQKLFVAVSQDIRVIIIKLADRLHNMRTLDYLPDYKKERTAKETLEIYVPIARRLGIRKLCRGLEDLSFKYVFSKEYQETKKLLNQKNRKDAQKLEKFQKSMKKVLAKNKITNFTVEYRVKTLYSLYNKLSRKDWNIEKVYDISALRIILSDINDCYKVLGIIHKKWKPLPNRIKDYIALPKTNGYKALHTTIFTGYGNVLEVQIKTKKMHRDAEYGIASHLTYKEKNNKELKTTFSWISRLVPFKNPFDNGNEDKSKKEAIREEIINPKDIPSWIKELVEYQLSAKDQETLEEELKDDFFKERIFIFTPIGDVIDLPVGSTPVDFAYAIHTEVGNTTSGAKIKGKLVSLETQLSNGDIVEIIINKEGKPNKKWLESVKTITAKKHIRAFVQKPK